MAYHERLQTLGALSTNLRLIQTKYLFTDMVLVFKSIHRRNIKCSIKQLGCPRQIQEAKTNAWFNNDRTIEPWLLFFVTEFLQPRIGY